MSDRDIAIATAILAGYYLGSGEWPLYVVGCTFLILLELRQRSEDP